MNLTKTWPFDEVNKHALAAYPPLLQEWCPGGKLVGKEYKALNPTRSDQHLGSFSVNVATGKWKDFSTGDEGGDPISLYAYLKCGGTSREHRNEACKRLAVIFGLTNDAPPPKRKPNLKVVPKPEAGPDEWQPGIPPDDAEPAKLKGWDHVFTYRDRDGRLLRYVVRNDARDGKDKEVCPLTYGVLRGVKGWHRKHPASPRCLYGLERLDGRPVLLQEGEKKTDQVEPLLPGYACLSLTQGSSAVNHNDLSTLAGLVVVYCPDNDEPGRKAARIIADKLVALGCTVLIVDTGSHGFPEKWDLGNAVEAGWDTGRLEAFISENAKPYQPDAGPADLEPPEDDDAEWKDDGPTDKRSLPPIPLGYDSGNYFYLSPMTGQIEVLARRAHTKQELIGIADLQYFRSLEQFKGEKGGLDWEAIGNFLKGACTDVGFYDPDKARGRGAWLDVHRHTGRERAVMNLGGRLIVDGESHPLLLPGSRYVYEAARPLKCVVADPLPKEQAAELMEICRLFSWEKPIYGTLMVGWMMTAIICGALPWRPALWVTGGSGSGKSTLEKLVVKRLLGGVGLFKKGGTTEAGIRQELGRDALPVIFDEAESENQKAKGIMQGLLDLNRQSSSEGGAQITKGTQSQTGAKTYHVRSSFMWSSINPMLEHLADESRVTVLELTGHDAEARAGFAAFVERIDRIITEDFAAGFVARAVWLMPNILKNVETFSRAVAVQLGSSRVGDQIGTLLAGAYACERDGLVSFETALKWVQEQAWDNITSANAVKDEERLTLRLFQQRIKIDLGDKVIERTVGEAMEEAAKDTGTDSVADVFAGLHQTALKRHGLKVEDGGVWISNTHKVIGEWLKDSPWSSQWGRSLRRIPGAKSSDPKVIVFSKLIKTKAVWLPFSAFEG